MRLIRRCFLLLLLLTLPAAAQSGEVIDLDGYEIELPDGWEVPEDYEAFYAMDDSIETLTVLHETGLEGLLVSPTQVADLLPEIDDLNWDEALVALLEIAYGLEIEVEDIDFAELGLVDGVRWTYTDEESLEDDVLAGDVYLIPLEDGGYLFADLYTFAEYFEEDLDALLFASEDLFVSAGALLFEQTDCLIYTDEADVTTVRVGPGENRTALLFLPVDVEFTVTGRFEDEDGSIWYQLDKEEIDPSTSAAEIWVAQAEVFEEGDCDLVTDADAPPLRPITRSNGSDEGSDEGNGGGSTEVEALPQEGDWQLTYASRGLVSCIGTETVEVDTVEAFGELTVPVSVSMSDDGSTIFFGEFTLGLVAPGQYSGDGDFDGVYGRIDLTVNGPNAMSGQLIADLPIEDTRCSGTFGFSVSR